MRLITLDVPDFDRPIQLQATQEAGANWNGQTIDLSFNLVFGGRLDTLLTPIALTQARLFAKRRFR